MTSPKTNTKHSLEHATVLSVPHLDPFFPLLSGEFMLVHHPTQGNISARLDVLQYPLMVIFAFNLTVTLVEALL